MNEINEISPLVDIKGEYEPLPESAILLYGKNYDLDEIRNNAAASIYDFMSLEGMNSKQQKLFTTSVEQLLHGLENKTILTTDLNAFNVANYNATHQNKMSDLNSKRGFHYDLVAVRYLNWVIANSNQLELKNKQRRQIDYDKEMDDYLINVLKITPETWKALDREPITANGFLIGYSNENRIKYLSEHLGGFVTWLQNKYKGDATDIPDDFIRNYADGLRELKTISNKKLTNSNNSIFDDISKTPWNELYTIFEKLHLSPTFVELKLATGYDPVRIYQIQQELKEAAQKAAQETVSQLGPAQTGEDSSQINKSYNGNQKAVLPYELSVPVLETNLISRLKQRGINIAEYFSKFLNEVEKLLFNNELFNQIIKYDNIINIYNKDVPFKHILTWGLKLITQNSSLSTVLTELENAGQIYNLQKNYYLLGSYNDSDGSILKFTSDSKGNIILSKVAAPNEIKNKIQSHKFGGKIRKHKLGSAVESSNDLDEWLNIFDKDNKDKWKNWNRTFKGTAWNTNGVIPQGLTSGTITILNLYDRNRAHANDITNGVASYATDAIHYLNNIEKSNIDDAITAYNNDVLKLSNLLSSKLDDNALENLEGWLLLYDLYTTLYPTYSQKYGENPQYANRYGGHNAIRTQLIFPNDNDHADVRTFNYDLGENTYTLHFKNDGTLEKIDIPIVSQNDEVPENLKRPDDANNPIVDRLNIPSTYVGYSSKNDTDPVHPDKNQNNLYLPEYNYLTPFIKNTDTIFQTLGNMAVTAKQWRNFDPSTYRKTPYSESALVYDGGFKTLASQAKAENMQLANHMLSPDLEAHNAILSQTLSNSMKSELDAANKDRDIIIKTSNLAKTAANKTYKSEVDTSNENAKLDFTAKERKQTADMKAIGELGKIALDGAKEFALNMIDRSTEGATAALNAYENEIDSLFDDKDDKALNDYYQALDEAEKEGKFLSMSEYAKRNPLAFGPTYQKLLKYNQAKERAKYLLHSGTGYGRKGWFPIHVLNRNFKKGGTVDFEKVKVLKEKLKEEKEKRKAKSKKDKDDRFHKESMQLSEHASKLVLSII